MQQQFLYEHTFRLENGSELKGLTIAYCTYGKMNADKSNVVWVCHALTANAAVTDWWPGVVGAGCAIDPDKHFIVCANILGSCYGSTGPTEQMNGGQVSFPLITIRDMVQAHILLRQHLGIDKIWLLAGGSMGGYQAMEWAYMEREVVQQLFLLATSASESAWGIAIHTAQRLAIEADSSWQQAVPEAGAKGLKAARAIGMLTYRNYELMIQQQSDTDVEKLDDFKVSSYISYQGEKLVKRFNTYSYWLLTKAMDTHNMARGRAANGATVLKQLPQRTLLIGIASDILCPVEEQRFIADHLPNCRYIEINSVYGHDGFLIEAEKITGHLREWIG